MADLEILNQAYVEGSPYPPTGHNRTTLFSANYQAAAVREHVDNGEHKPPFVARAGATVRWTGAAYALGPSKNVLSVTRIGAGEVEITLSQAMRIPRWGLVAWKNPDSEAAFEPLAPVYRPLTLRTPTKIRVRIAAFDCGFTFLAMDQRL